MKEYDIRRFHTLRGIVEIVSDLIKIFKIFLIVVIVKKN